MTTDRKQTLRDLIEKDLLITVDKIGWRGEGLSRFADGWLSVRGVHAGEEVSVKCASTLARPGKLYASLEQVLTPSAERVDTGCPEFPRCAGCHLRHYSRSGELEFKRGAIREIFEKFTNFNAEDLPSIEIVAGPADGARRRGSLTRIKDRFGLRVPGEEAVIDMASCPALTGEARKTVGVLQELVLESNSNVTRIHWAQGRSRAWVELEGADDGLSDKLVEAGFRVSEHDPTNSSPDTTIEVERIGCTLEEGPGAWSHTTRGPSEALYLWCRENLRNSPSVLDLGCGIGTLSLLASTLGATRVVGVDASRIATSLARRNAMRHDFAIDFLTADFEKAARDLAIQKVEFDTTIINPMREPVGERVVGYADRITSRRVIYLAPSPAAGARDIESLRQRGWTHVKKLAAIDLHPMTYHVMLGAVLESEM